MPARRRRRLGTDRLYITSEDGLPLGHLDLITRQAHDVPSGYRDRFAQEANTWLWHNNMPTMGGPDEGPEPAALGAGVEAPDGGWEAGWEDLALHRPGHGLGEQAAAARAQIGKDADRPYRLRADGQHAVDDALAKLTRAPALRRGRGPRWRILHAVPIGFEGGEVLVDHVVMGPPGMFVVEVANIPGGRVVVGPDSLEIDEDKIDLGRRRRIGEVAATRLSAALARAAGAVETLNPPSVTPVIAVVGAIVVGGDRPRGVLVSRVGPLPRILQAFGTPLTDLAVAQIHQVARRSDTWSP